MPIPSDTTALAQATKKSAELAGTLAGTIMPRNISWQLARLHISVVGRWWSNLNSALTLEKLPNPGASEMSFRLRRQAIQGGGGNLSGSWLPLLKEVMGSLTLQAAKGFFQIVCES